MWHHCILRDKRNRHKSQFVPPQKPIVSMKVHKILRIILRNDRCSSFQEDLHVIITVLRANKTYLYGFYEFHIKKKKKKLKNDHPKVHLGFPFVSEVPTCSVTHKKDSQDSAYICTHSCSLLQGQQGRKTQVESEEVHLRASSALSLP